MTRTLLSISLLLGVTTCAFGQAQLRQWYDPAGDATLRKTDPGADGLVLDESTLPDLVHISLAGWKPSDPVNNPFVGQIAPGTAADIFRLTVTFRGLVNPPGPLGLAGEAYDPFRFGDNPAYGFLDIDVDADIETGGVLGGAAQQRYLANVARFGRVPTGDLAGRAAETGDDLDGNFFSGPFHEQSGADFTLALCGCWAPTIDWEGGDGDGVFDPGETWFMEGRFFERAIGYEGASFAFGGSDFFLYDPLTRVRYAHATNSNTTTITVVFPLTMKGAATLSGQPEQPIDFNVSNHTSIVEALTDVVTAANAGLNGPVAELAADWADRDPFDYLNPLDWTVTAIFGTAYAVEDDAFFAWTDTGVSEKAGDLNGDGVANETDEGMLIAAVYTLDGGTKDADGVINGVVVLEDPGLDFNIHDVDGDGEIKLLDRYVYGDPADVNNDDKVDLLDFVLFQMLIHSGSVTADFNLDQKVDVVDFVAFQAAASK